MGIGSVCGFASGYALKKVGKVTAVVFGLGFIGFQIARHQGLVENPDWQRIEQEITRRLDADGDGKITNAVRVLLSQYLNLNHCSNYRYWCRT